MPDAGKLRTRQVEASPKAASVRPIRPAAPASDGAPSYDSTNPRNTLKIAGRKSAEGSVERVRINWQLKAVLPVAFVLLNGLLLFLLSTLSWQDPERHL